jgi:soluble lytic murein transglycosylase-like protein
MKKKIIKCVVALLFVILLFSNQTFFKEKMFVKEGKNLEEIYKIVKDYNDAYQILNETQTENVPLDLFLSLVQTESKGNKHALNTKNRNGSWDIGYCQLNTNSYKDKTVIELMNPKTNIHLGILHLKKALQQVQGNQTLALLIYNAGYGAFCAGNVFAPTYKYAKNIIEFKNKINLV